LPKATGELTAAYVASLLERADFWAMAALEDARPIGGINAHVLPMTRSEARELFIYDLAVAPAHQRRGVGRLLVETLCREAAAAGVPVASVPADDEDDHALAFYRALGGEPAPVTIFSFEHGPDDDSPPQDDGYTGPWSSFPPENPVTCVWHCARSAGRSSRSTSMS
jgi:aminoglycoside 3-N-acetyltransferase I